MPIGFSISILNEKYALISFECDDVFLPEELKAISPPDVVRSGLANRGIILAGRGPIWLYCFLTHYYHPTRFVATYDPRMQGAVVVESHTKEYNVGDIISIDKSLITTGS